MPIKHELKFQKKTLGDTLFASKGRTKILQCNICIFPTNVFTTYRRIRFAHVVIPT